MSKWPTIEELIAKPSLPLRNDPFFHTQQFPVFMKRKSILQDTYQKPKKNMQFKVKKPFKPRTVDRNSPSQWTFQAYGKFFRHKTANKTQEIHKTSKETYDEAFDNQEIFTKISPTNDLFEGEYKHSTCPHEITPLNTQTTKRHKKMKTDQWIHQKINTSRDEHLTDLMQSSVQVLISRNSPKKCQDCSKNKCECIIIDEEIPKSFYENITKGKELLESIREKKRKSSPRSPVMKSKKKVVLCEDLMRYTSPLPALKTSGNIPTGNYIKSKYRRYSS